MKESKALNREQKIELIALLEEKRRRQAKTNLLDFTEFTMPTFKAAPFHEIYYKILDLFAQGKIKNLAITMPPQHGKSEGSTRRLPAYLLGKNPNLKIAVGSYNATLARKFNREIQRIIDDEEYYSLFPETLLNESNVVTITDSYLRNSEEFEIVGHRGSLKAVGRGGALTGNPVDIMIMDDLYKDYAEGNSPIIRAAVADWYTTVVKTRLHNDSQQLIVFTRWHEEDLIGILEAEGRVVEIKSLDDVETVDSRSFVKVNFEAIMEQEASELDDREQGVPLWAERHSLEKLEDDRKSSREKFSCLYQGNPESAEGRLYEDFGTYTDLPSFTEIKNYTDTADKGTDVFCSVSYGVSSGKYYVLDVLYTVKSMKYTEEYLPMRLIEHKVRKCEIESNNGGEGFSRVVRKAVGNSCSIKSFNQSSNKESRILTNSNLVTEQIIMPADWSVKWPEFYDDVIRFKRLFKANKQDGGPDVLTGIIEKNQKATRRRFMN